MAPVAPPRRSFGDVWYWNCLRRDQPVVRLLLGKLERPLGLLVCRSGLGDGVFGVLSFDVHEDDVRVVAFRRGDDSGEALNGN
jgi:hypothetical protein